MKKVLSLVAVGLIIVGSFSGCTSKEISQEDVTPIVTSSEKLENENKVDKEASFPIVVTDQLGREVEIKEEPQRIISSYYITSSLLIALEAEDKVVGLEMKADTREIYKLAAPQFLELPAVGNSKTLNIEESLALNPDLMIIPTRLKEFIPQLEALRIPVIAVEPESMEQFLGSIELIGEAIGKVDKANELIQYHLEVMEMATEMTQEVENRPSVYLAGSGDVLKTTTSQMYQHSLIEMAGGLNVSGELTDGYWATISPEELIKWNPEYIYAVSYADYGLEAITEDAKYGEIDAVLNGNVYTFPSVIEPWDYPTPSSALGILWLMNNLHPELYSKEAYLKEAEEFYKSFYDITVTSEALGV